MAADNSSSRCRARSALWAALAGCGLGLAACGGGSGDGGVVASRAAAAPAAEVGVLARGRQQTGSTAVQTQPANTAGRLLASNCFQCHGTLGLGGFEKIRGKDAAEVVEYLGKPANSSLMAAHAQGYSREQLQAIVAYLQQ